MEIFSLSATAEGHWKLVRMHSSRMLLPTKFRPLSAFSLKVELMCLRWLLGILHCNWARALCQFPKRFPWLPQLFFGLLLESLNFLHLKLFSGLGLRLSRLGFGLTFPMVCTTTNMSCMHANTVEILYSRLFKMSWYREVSSLQREQFDNEGVPSFQGLGTEEFHRTPTCLTDMNNHWVYLWNHHTTQQPQGSPKKNQITSNEYSN